MAYTSATKVILAVVASQLDKWIKGGPSDMRDVLQDPEHDRCIVRIKEGRQFYVTVSEIQPADYVKDVAPGHA